MTRIHFVCKENKNYDFIQQFVSAFPLRHRSAILESIRWTQTVYAVHGYAFYIYLHFDLNENSVSVWCGWHRTAYAVCIQRIFSKMALRWRRGENCWIKSLFLFSLHTKSILITLRLNHWWQMGYFDDVFHTFQYIHAETCSSSKIIKGRLCQSGDCFGTIMSGYET